VPVISVGNLTVGGTGKTPCIASLVPLVQDILRQRGISGTPAILTRGYGRRTRSSICLGSGLSDSVDWREVGDEPMMLHRLLPKVPIIVEPDRVRGARIAIRDYQASALLLDDGFQYRALHKDFEIVLVDNERPLGNGYLLPAGPLREPADALQRADIVVGVGSKRDDETPAARLAQHYGKFFSHAFLQAGKPLPFAVVKTEEPPKKIVLLSGIARSDRFSHSATESGFHVLKHFSFPDHYPFCQSDIAQVERRASKLGAEAILTTAKDAVRLAELSFKLPVWILPVELVWKSSEEITRTLTKVFGDSPD
ncbi:MAG: tetraacyldisaccharide 4'-kinase, partial [Calditrichaeota bacterium]|nr:tetraacyldisaccharide 4'-kinase [Calditrichota bacterium]